MSNWARHIPKFTWSVIVLGAVGWMTVESDPGGWLGAPTQAALAEATKKTPAAKDARHALEIFVHRLAKVGMCEAMLNQYVQFRPNVSAIYEMLNEKLSRVEKLERRGMVLWTNRISGWHTCGALIGGGWHIDAAEWAKDPVVNMALGAGRALSQHCVLEVNKFAAVFDQSQIMIDATVNEIAAGKQPARNWPIVVTTDELEGATAKVDALTYGIYGRCQKAVDDFARARELAARK